LFILFNRLPMYVKLFGPKVKYNEQANEKVEKFRIKSRRSVNVA